MEKIRNLILYAGLSKADYEKIRKEITMKNLNRISMYSAVGAFMFGLLILATVITQLEILKSNFYLYKLAFAFSLISHIALRFWGPKSERAVFWITNGFAIALYIFGIVLSCQHTDIIAVTFMVFVVCIPLIYYDLPINMFTLTTLVVILYDILVVRIKNADIVTYEIGNSVLFMLLAFVVETQTSYERFHSFLNYQNAEYLSTTDVMTGAKNRNSYEEKINNLKKNKNTSGLACIYIDANGLHELNNSQGHQAGDKMLQTIAKELICCFDEENVYRFGGDEFVVICLNNNHAEIEKHMQDISASLALKNYYISYGIEECASNNFDIEELVKKSEGKMYEAKNRFYMSSNHDRRKR